jgi:hypothetical protein
MIGGFFVACCERFKEIASPEQKMFGTEQKRVCPNVGLKSPIRKMTSPKMPLIVVECSS